MPFAASLPTGARSSAAPPPPRHAATASGLDESFTMLAARLHGQKTSTGRSVQAIGVTSCHTGEGVTTVARHLAAALTRLNAGRVLLVETNSHGGGPNRAQAGRPAPSSAELDQLVEATPVNGLFRLDAGRTLRLFPDRVQQQIPAAVIQEARADFGVVLVDLPALDAGDTALLWAAALDGFLLVLEAEKVRSQVAQRVRSQLEQTGTPILGAVINKRPHHIPQWLYRNL